MTSVYRKPTFSGVFTNFGSFIPKSYKYNLLFTLLHRAFKLCSNFERFHEEIDKLKTIFENNGYPKSSVDFCIKKYLDKVFIKKESSTESLEKRTSKFYSKLWTHIFVIRTDYFRETGSPLPQLSVPKKSQV